MTTAADVYARARAVLLDFDGPMCSVFAAVSPHAVAAEMLAALRRQGFDPPASWERQQDPHQLLRDVWQGMPRPAIQEAEQALTAAELRAVDGATMTPGPRDLLDRLDDRQWAVVSNNSRASIRGYCNANLGRRQPHAIAGRPEADPGRMKPSPF